MRIAAVYIYANSLPHIFGEEHQEVTLNLGGRFLYEIKYTTRGLQISDKKENKQFIRDFWSTNIKNVSAIVGANGSGKSTILHLLKTGSFNLVCETEDGSPEIIYSKYPGVFIYYSPYLSDTGEEYDRKFTYNLSKLSLFKNDVPNEPLNFQTCWELHKSEQFKRILSFINSDIFSEDLRNLNIPVFSQIKIKIKKIYKENSDSPRNFRPFFDAFRELKEQERVETERAIIEKLGLKSDEIRQSGEYMYLSRQLRLKLEILDGIISKIHSILESSGNKYLEEGFIQNDIYPSDSSFAKITNLKEAFYWFLDRAFIIKDNDEFRLPIEKVKNLTELLHNCAERDENIENWTELTVNFDDSLKIIEVYKEFLLSFKDRFSYDTSAMLTFTPDIRLSTGEIAMYELFSVLYDLRYHIENDLNDKISLDNTAINYENYIILLDEADLGFHPMWKRMFVNSLVVMFPKIFPDKNIQIILTTHSPLSLSDIPSNNMVLLAKDTISGNTILSQNEESRMHSFGANINDLFANSFFLEEYLIGDFAKRKIDEVILWIKENKSNEEYNREEYEIMQKVISLIEEPVLRNKLVEMLSEIELNEQFIEEMIKKETSFLRGILRRNND